MAVTYNDLTLDIRRSLRQAGIEAATLEARELVCFAAGKDKARLLRDGALYASPEVEEAAWALARRRLAGEPVAYLIGEWEFYGLPLDIDRQVLIPRADTETLVDCALPFLRQNPGSRVLDLCAGSGCIGLAVASQVGECRVTLGDVSEGALRICRQNIRRNGLTDRVAPMILSPTAPWTAARMGWIFIAPSPPCGGKLCAQGGCCFLRWVSARRTMCCGLCAPWASETWRSRRTRRAYPGWYMADCTTRYNWRKIFDFSAKGLAVCCAHNFEP